LRFGGAKKAPNLEKRPARTSFLAPQDLKILRFENLALAERKMYHILPELTTSGRFFSRY
jgi:hypothetical protein